MWQAMFPAETERALADRALRPSPPPPERTSAWAQLGAIVAAPYTGFAQGVNESLRVANKAYSLMPGAGGAAMGVLRDEQLRSGVEFWRPDAQSATWASSFLHEASRVVSKVAGYGLAAGPAGAIVGTSLDEGATGYLSLRDRGVDPATAAKVGAVKAGTTAVSVAAPVAGRTIAQTAGIVLGAGPGAFVAEQALSRSILEHARYREIASEFDPFDPAGLVLSLVPGAVVGAGVHAARARRAKASAASTAAAPSAPASPPPGEPAAAMAEHGDTVAAAHVAYQREVIDAHQLAPAHDLQARATHERALLEARAAMDEARPMELGDLAVDPKRAADLQAEIVRRVQAGDEARAAAAAAELRMLPRAAPEALDPRTLPEVVRALEIWESVRHIGTIAAREAAQSQPDAAVHNLVIGMDETNGNQAKLARLLEQYQRRMLARTDGSGMEAAAEVITEMRGDKPMTIAERSPVERAMMVARSNPDMPVRLEDDGSAASGAADVMTRERKAAGVELDEAQLAYQAAIECILETEVG